MLLYKATSHNLLEMLWIPASARAEQEKATQSSTDHLRKTETMTAKTQQKGLTQNTNKQR